MWLNWFKCNFAAVPSRLPAQVTAAKKRSKYLAREYNAKDREYNSEIKGNTIQKIKGNKLLNWHSSSLEASLHPSLGKYLATTSLPSSKLYDARRQPRQRLVPTSCIEH